MHTNHKKIMFAITALLGAAAVTLFIFQVMLFVSDREAGGNPGELYSEAKDGTIETGESIGNVVTGAFSAAAYVLGIISLPMIFFMFALLLLSAVGIGISSFGQELSASFDSAFTEVWPEFYETIILGILDPVRAMYNAIIPLSNSINGSWRILRLEALELAAECKEVDWGEVALKIRNTVVDLAAALVSWVLSFGGVDFDLFTPTRDLQEAITEIAPIFTCWCDATSMVRSLVELLTSQQLAAVLDRAVNLPIALMIDLIHSTFGIMVHFAQEIATTGNFVSALGDFYWDPLRAPTVDRTMHTLAQLASRLFDLLDDVVVVIMRLFYDIPREDVPRFLAVLGNYIESIILDINIIIASWGTAPFRRISLLGTRYSAIWNVSRLSALRTEDQLTEAFGKAYNASALIEEFFDEISATMTDIYNASHSVNETELALEFTGCMMHEGIDILTNALESFARAWVALWHERLDDGSWGDYMSNSSIVIMDRALNSSVRFMDCAAGFSTIIDDELGQFINETGHIFKAFVDPFFELQKEWNERASLLNSTGFKDMVDRVFFEADAWAIAAGDFWRQFSFVANQTVQDTHCRLRDVHLEQFPPTVIATTGGTVQQDWETFYPYLVDPFCCFGSVIETGTRLIFGLFEGITRGIVVFAVEDSLADGFVAAFGPNGPLDIEREFLPMIDFFLRDAFRFSCIKAGIIRGIADVYFSGFDHVCDASGKTIFEYAVDVLTDVVRVPIKFFLGGFGIIFQWTVALVGSTPDACGASTSCWCTQAKLLYRETLGESFTWSSDFIELISCVFGLTKLGEFADDLEGTLGRTGSIATGDFICVFVDFAADIWDMFECWFEGHGFFTCLSQAAAAMLHDFIDKLVNVCLKALWNNIRAAEECVIGGLKSKWNNKTVLQKAVWFLPPFVSFFVDFGKQFKDCLHKGLIFNVPTDACTFQNMRGDFILDEPTPLPPPTETITITQHICHQFVLHSPEWYECVRNHTNNFTETVTITAEHTRSTTFTTGIITKTVPGYETEQVTWGIPPYLSTYTRIAHISTVTPIVVTTVYAAKRRIETFAAPVKKRADTQPSETTSGASPIRFNFSIEDLSRWCAVDVTYLYRLQNASELNAISVEVSADQRSINAVLLESGIDMANASQARCIVSAILAKIADIGLGFVSDNETLVNPLAFYHPIVFLDLVWNLIVATPLALDYTLDTISYGIDPSTLTDVDFYDHLELNLNETNKLQIGLALFVERILRTSRVIAASVDGTSIFGHIIETMGQWFGRAPRVLKIANSKAKATGHDYYDDAPLHPAGWKSPKWLAFVERYRGRFLDGLDAFNAGAGWNPRGLGFEYYDSAKSKVLTRYEWNLAGRVPDDEPYPRGTIKERSVWANLAMQAEDPRYVWESEEGAVERRAWALKARDATFPSLAYLAQEDDEVLIPGDVLCTPGVSGDDVTCNGRACWDASGALVGRCITRADPLFGSPVCGCEYDDVAGACCTDTSCSNVANAVACASPGVFAPVSTCASGVCSDVRGACCAANATCAVTAGHANCTGTFLTGSNCSACADETLTAGACCSGGNCSMTNEAFCNASNGTWNVGQNCSSSELSSECGHCAAPACKQCELLFEVLNDVIDLWIINLEGFRNNATRGACCYGESSSNRSCVLVQRSECLSLPDPKWFWGEQCSFCDGALAFSFANPPPRKVAQLNIGEVEDLVLRALNNIVNGAIRVLEWLEENVRIVAWLIPDSIVGATFDAHAFAESAVRFLFADDPDDPGSLRFWLEFLFVCDPFNDPRPERGRQGLGLVKGLIWSTFIFTVIYATVFRWWGFLGSLLAGILLLFAWLGLTLVIAYFYSPACLFPAYVSFGIRAPVRFVEFRRNHPVRVGFFLPPFPDRLGIPGIGSISLTGLKTRLASLRARMSGLTRRVWRAAQSIFIFSITFPLLPISLANDIMELFEQLDMKCLPHCDIACPRENNKWPCAWMTQEDEDAGIRCLPEPDCCRVAECPPNRVFPDCESDPYKFTSSTREFAYWFRMIFPKANCFLFHSDFFLLSWIRDIPTFREHFDFPGNECDDEAFVDAKWEYCANLNVLLLSPWLIFLVIGIVLILSFAMLVWIVFKSFLKFWRFIATFWTAASRNAVRATISMPETGEGRLSSRSGGPVGSGPVLGHARERATIKKD